MDTLIKRASAIVVADASVEDIKENLHTYLAQGLALADSWGQIQL